MIDTSKHYQIMRDAKARQAREAEAFYRSAQLALLALLTATNVLLWTGVVAL